LLCGTTRSRQNYLTGCAYHIRHIYILGKVERIEKSVASKVGCQPPAGGPVRIGGFTLDRAEIYDLPVFTVSVQEKKDGPDGHPSSRKVVAGAAFDTDSPSSWDWEEIELEALAAAMA